MTNFPIHPVRNWLVRWELVLMLLVVWLIFISVPLTLGRIGLGWDGMNHQIYLGWVAETPRFDRDYMAASLQAYQFPYLYWPAYKLAISGVSGEVAGVVLSTLHVMAVVPMWMIAKLLVGGSSFLDIVLRCGGVLLGLMSAVPLKTLEATGNDLLAAIPLLWAIAVGLKVLCASHSGAVHHLTRDALIAGLWGGAAVACKLSNGPLAIFLPCAMAFLIGPWRLRMNAFISNAVGLVLGFVGVYGYWGYQLWLQFGNPIFPFYDTLWEPLRIAVGWSQ